MAEKPEDFDSLARQAREKELRYDWKGAAETYAKSCSAVPQDDLLKKGDLEEALAYTHYRAAFQSDNPDEFRKELDGSTELCREAKEVYGKCGNSDAAARMIRCEAMINYISFWHTKEASEKRARIFEAWRLTIESLKAFERLGDWSQFIKTCDKLALTYCDRSAFHESFQEDEEDTRMMLEVHEQAIRQFPEGEDRGMLARIYVRAAVCLESCALCSPSSAELRREFRQKAQHYWLRAKELSEEDAAITLWCAYNVLGPTVPFGLDEKEYMGLLSKSLDVRRRTKDRVVIGSSLEELGSFTLFSVASAAEDTDERDALAEKALRYAIEAQKEYSALSLTSSTTVGSWSGEPYFYHYAILSYLENDLKKKRALAIKAMETVPHALALAESLGCRGSIGHVRYLIGNVLTQLAMTEQDMGKKRDLLGQAMEHARYGLKIQDELNPYLYWNRGWFLSNVASIEHESAKIAEDAETKKTMLSRAISDRKEGLNLIEKDMSSMLEQVPGDNAMVARLLYDYGEWLNELWSTDGIRDHLSESAGAYESAVKSHQIADTPSRSAECYWKAARAYDSLGQHAKSSERFLQASEQYKLAADKLPKFRDFYLEYSQYMEAWGEIEKALHHHMRQEHKLAKTHYDKASQLHKTLKRWDYLAANYQAWAEIENAEELSRLDKGQDARRSFERAGSLFQEARKTIRSRLGSIEDADERQTGMKLAEAADLRREYCKARMELEEAKLMDRSGDEYGSSERYGKAAEILQKVFQNLKTEEDRKEIQLIIILAKAWQAMARAETEASSSLYEEAAKLFEQAKDLSSGEKAKLMALGHCRFCKALEVGTRFADTGDIALHASATQHLESAANHYLKAGLESASEYAKGSKLLFDGYVYMGKASKEEDQETKAKFYSTAEKVFRASASAFEKSGQSKKQEQVLKLLEKAKEERELATSLTDVFLAPDIVSTTMAFSALAPTHEVATGLERFEHADVQATVIARKKELHVGEDLGIDLELANAGRAPAQLMKIEDLIPNGFDVVESPSNCRIEEGCLNMRGRRLDPLKTEEAKLVLKPTIQGRFTIKPRIMYLDDSGAYKYHEAESVEILVKELGISGWLKGPEKKK